MTGRDRLVALPLEPSLVQVAISWARCTWLERTSEWLPPLIQLMGLALGLVSPLFLGRLVDAAPNPKLGSYVGHFEAFLLVGMIALDLQATLVATLGRRIREAQQSGSLEVLLVTPTPVSYLLFAMALSDLAGALLRLLLYLGIGLVLFGLRPATLNWAGVVAIVAAAIACFAAFALVSAAATMILRRSDPLGVLLAAASLFAGGVAYPRSVLPSWAASIGGLLPITPVVEGLRAAVLVGAGPAQLGRPLGHLAGLAVVVGPIGAWLFFRALRQARANGSLTASC